MRKFGCLLGALMLLGGCATRQYYDPYELATVEETVDNKVSGSILARTIVRLNARRETRYLTTLTNQSIVVMTNVSLNYITNQTITVSSNLVQTLATNEVPALALAPTSAVDTNNTNSDTPLPVLPNPLPNVTTNVAITTANNVTTSRAGNQTVTTASSQLQRSRQITTSTNNLSITAADNYNLSVETNLVVTILTNVSVSSLTNASVVLTNLPVYDYFLVLEYTAPPDFTLQTGESLVLAVDGVRHGLTQTPTPFVLIPDKGYTAGIYHVSAQLLVDIGNARKVQIRLKGNGAVIERTMSQASRNRFKKFLVKFFIPADAYVEDTKPVSRPMFQPVPGPSENSPALPNS